MLASRTRELRLVEAATSAEDGKTEAVSDAQRGTLGSDASRSSGVTMNRFGDGRANDADNRVFGDSTLCCAFRSEILEAGEYVGLSTCIARKHVSTSKSSSISDVADAITDASGDVIPAIAEADPTEEGV